MKALLGRPIIIGSLATAAALFVLIPGVSGQVGWTDHGELVAAASLLGVPHPTGYPLLMVASRALLVLTQSADPVWMLNLFSAVMIAVSGGLLAALIARVLGPGVKVSTDTALASLVTVVVFVSVQTVREQALSYEVYALQTLLFVLSLLAWYNAREEGKTAVGSISRWWAVAGLLVGFGLANHMSTVYLLPALAVFVVRTAGLRPFPARLVLLGGTFVLLGASIYVLLPLRAAVDPPLNWGDPDSLGRFVAHVTGKQYRVWMFSGGDAFLGQMKAFVAGLPSDVGWFGLVLSALGMVWLFGKRRTEAIVWLVCAVTAAFWSFNYDILDLEAYFLLTYVVVSLSAGAGAFSLLQLALRRSVHWSLAVRVLLASTAILVGASRLTVVSADDTAPDAFTRRVLGSVGDSATVLTVKWDFLYSPALALQNLASVRPDVRMVDIHLLRDRSWYAERQRSIFAADDPGLDKVFDRFIAELRLFESGRPFSYDVLKMRWTDLLGALLRAAERRGPVYADHVMATEISGLAKLKPEGYLLRCWTGAGEPQYTGLPGEFLPGSRSDEFGNDFRRFLSSALANHALYARSISLDTVADTAVRRARALDPANPHLQFLQQQNP